MWSDIVLAAIKVDEITGSYSDSSMDLAQIEKAMVKVMPDYGSAVDKDTPQFQIGFAGKILFEIGPGLRKSKQGNVLSRFKFQWTMSTSKSMLPRTKIMPRLSQITPMT